MRKNNETYSLIKKLIVLGVAAVAIGIIIKRFIDNYIETVEKINGISEGEKEYTASFESKEYNPGCSFKGGGLRTMFSDLTFNINNLKSDDDVSITCNAVASKVDIIVPDDINVVTIDVAKASSIRNKALAPFDCDKKTLKVYISGFMSSVTIKKVN